MGCPVGRAAERRWSARAGPKDPEPESIAGGGLRKAAVGGCAHGQHVVGFPKNNSRALCTNRQVYGVRRHRPHIERTGSNSDSL